VTGDLVFAAVLLQVGELEAPQIEVERLAREEPLAGTVPVPELDDVQVVELAPHQLILERLFGALGDVERELVAVEVGARQLPCIQP
jgi:hypothetical protein